LGDYGIPSFAGQNSREITSISETAGVVSVNWNSNKNWNRYYNTCNRVGTEVKACPQNKASYF